MSRGNEKRLSHAISIVGSSNPELGFGWKGSIAWRGLTGWGRLWPGDPRGEAKIDEKMHKRKRMAAREDAILVTRSIEHWEELIDPGFPLKAFGN